MYVNVGFVKSENVRHDATLVVIDNFREYVESCHWNNDKEFMEQFRVTKIMNDTC